MHFIIIIIIIYLLWLSYSYGVFLLPRNIFLKKSLKKS